MKNLKLKIVDLFEAFGPAYRKHVSIGLPPGISTARLQIMAILADKGAMPMRELGQAIGASAQNVTGLVDALEQDGIIKREHSPHDRRVILVRLSENCAEQIKEQRTKHREEVAKLFSCLTKSEQEKLIVILDKLTQGIRNSENSQ